MSAPDVELRRAVPQDALAIATIWQQGWRDGHLGNVPAELIAARQAESFSARAAQRVNGHVAGFVMVVGDEVEQVYVAGEHRGSGVAGISMATATPPGRSGRSRRSRRGLSGGAHRRRWTVLGDPTREDLEARWELGAAIAAGLTLPAG